MTTIQFLNRLQSLNIKIWLEDEKIRFRAPADSFTDTLKAELTERKAELVTLLRQRQSVREPMLVRASRDVPIPLTFAQQRLWFLDQLHPGVPAYNVYDATEIAHEIDLPALRRAVNELFRRHELLRTSFPAVDGVPIQRIAPPSQVPVPVVDISRLPLGERMAEAQRLAWEEARVSFDLAHGPLLRISLIKLDTARYLWLLTIHHIVSDDWSKKLLNQELEALYTAYSAGLPSPLPELPIQWADFAVWQHQWLSGEVLDSHVEYWAKQLEGKLPTLNLAMDHPRREPPWGRKGKFFFPSSLSSALRSMCESEGVTLFMALLAGYAALLSRHSRQNDIIIGSAISDRNRVETESLIGFLLNTLPLRVRVDDQASFRDLLHQAKEVCLGAYSYQAVPYETLMRRLVVERNTSGSPLFQTMLTLLNTPPVQRGSNALWGHGPDSFGDDLASVEADFGAYARDVGIGTTMFDFSITLVEHSNGILGRTEYNADIFEEETIAKLIERFQILLRSAAADPGRKIFELAMMTEPQCRDLLASWSTGPRLPHDFPYLHQFVEREAELHPSAIAIEEEDGKCFSYAELNGQANQVAHRLRRRGVLPETMVGIFFARSMQMYVAVIAVMKAGGAYVPLDATYPAERLDFILDDAGVELLVTMEPMARLLQTYSNNVLCLDREADEIAAESTLNPDCVVHANNAACVLYTSGSTGRPKGVVLLHHALANYIEDTARSYGISGSDRILQFASIAFDASLEDSFLAFARGAALVLRPERMLDSISGFVEHCRRMRLTTLVLPTVYWHELVAGLDTLELPVSLRRVIIGGERALPENLVRWQSHIEGQIDFFNTYGPTEGTISVTRCLLPARAGEESARSEVPIGGPVANCTVYVLDQWMQPVPPGVPGEVFLGGLAIARGYLHKAALTAEKFLPDPFSPTPGERLYMTGDLARFLPDGNLEYRGRVDGQVKIRGYRIEPREIELVLQEHEAVEDLVVITREDEPGDKRLVVYIVLQEGSELDAAKLRAFLKPKLPSYMLPSAFVFLPVLPLNANGKVNHAALPKPDGARTDLAQDGQYIHASTPTEKNLSAIWMSVLHLERIGVTENFFDLGGHSLLATRVVARVNDTMNIDLPLRRLFEAPTISELALIVENLMQTTSGERDRLTSLRGLFETTAGNPLQSVTDHQESDGKATSAGIDRMLDGLERMADIEIDALLEEENDPGLDRLH